MTDDRNDRVRRRAYEMWEQQGGEHGRHEDHWHSASAEIDAATQAEEASTAAPDGTTLTSPATDEPAGGDAASAASPEEKPARKRAAPKAAAKTSPAEKAPAKPRKAK
ncbi:DUF2934 domain-containing protein [Sphingomonas rubra]|uniref:DUF2934 domain-containing protein n=1 Tax=Sphingomonas rubra TaxID=634430 RepID=A0A1I5R8T7_9SPHN|nr:DUF2934 domain-containing protein [Sphingomonas rubra]SFP54954.1 Protein of unknown function [Sphingomonas rubra]